MPKNHHHRSGPLSQSNKKNKRTKSSKRSLTRQAGGKVDTSGSHRRLAFKQTLSPHNKADRRHIQQQKRDAKRQELIRKKRGIDGHGIPPPKIVGIISLSSKAAIEESLQNLILQQADQIIKPEQNYKSPVVTAKFNKHKKDGNLTILTNTNTFRSQYSSSYSDDDAAIFAALDLCRICDILLFVIDADANSSEDDFVGMNIGGGNDNKSLSTNRTSQQDWDHLISDRGDRILSAVKSQGLPRVVTVLAKTEADMEFNGHDDDDHDLMTTQSAKSLHRANLKRKTDLKKYVSRFATTEFGVDNDKVLAVNLKQQNNNVTMQCDGIHDTHQPTNVDPEVHAHRVLADSLVRCLCCMSATPSNWVSNIPRPYIVSDSHKYDPNTQELHITGYVRGIAPLDVNSLIHIPNLGTYACKSILKAKNPYNRSQKNVGDMEGADDENLIESDPRKRESLDRFATPDALEGEQNLVGFDEEDEEFNDGSNDAGKSIAENNNSFARPAGWSDYQSAWLDAVDDNAIDDDDFDHGELAKELNKKSTGSVATNAMDLDDANEISEAERQALIEQRRKLQSEHLEFPDEVQVNEDEKARDRFARYRSLKSFKKSHWDPKENLPDSYASIFHFARFKTTQRAVMAEMRDLIKASEACNGQFWNGLNKSQSLNSKMEENSGEDDEDILVGCIPSGSYVTLTLEAVKQEDYSSVATDSLLCSVSLLPHENKVSVLHMGLSNCKESEVPVKSKDVLTFRCGWRTWTGRPVFSQNNLNCDKHKFERFLPQAGSFFAASVFGPVTYTPCPVLVFRDTNGSKELVASGSMIGADADRIIVKRIILTGYPVRVHKRFASVKYMFYDPEDVKWFKPAGLTTKHGLNGKIEESVGEHGTMKCLFNAPIKQHDTVCLCLYKRNYPKFVEDSKAGDEDGTIRTIGRRNKLEVK